VKREGEQQRCPVCQPEGGQYPLRLIVWRYWTAERIPVVLLECGHLGTHETP
jgi:hypothetical protein